MQSLLNELEVIEATNKEFFDTKTVRLYYYINLSKKPVMIRFNNDMDNKVRLPQEIYDTVKKLISTYYGT